jgi:hypothetical protein
MEKNPEDKPPSGGIPAGSPLRALEFLLGRWQAEAKPGEPSGEFAFTPELQSRVIVRTNYSEYPATQETPASRHDDLMIIYADEGGAMRADYYDSEGHVIHYRVDIPESGLAVFLCEPGPSAPGFRLSYRLDESGRMFGTFEVAPPGAPATFNPYLSWSAFRL